MKLPTYPATRLPLGGPKAYLDIPCGEREYTDPQGYRILWCHSQGDTRFSPLCAHLGTGLTIEVTYQKLKRDQAGHSIPVRQGHDTPCTCFHLGGHSWPLEMKHEIWYLLWNCYFAEHPDLVAILKQYQGFRDAFDGRGGETFYVDDPLATGDQYATLAQNAAQSRALCWRARDRLVHPDLQRYLDFWQGRYGPPTS